MKVVRSLRLVCSLRWLVTTMRFSGQANAHRLQEMHSVSPLSGLMLSRGAPRYRSPTLGRSAGYCSVYIRLGSWLRKVTQRPWKRSTRKIFRKRFKIMIAPSPARRSRSPVHLAEHDIQSTNNRDHIGHQTAAHHAVQRLQIHERGRPHTHAIRLRGIVADDEIAELALGRFDRDINLAHGRLHYFGHLAHDGSGGDAVHRLPDDARGLPHLLHAHRVPVVCVA